MHRFARYHNLAHKRYQSGINVPVKHAKTRSQLRSLKARTHAMENTGPVSFGMTRFSPRSPFFSVQGMKSLAAYSRSTRSGPYFPLTSKTGGGSARGFATATTSGQRSKNQVPGRSRKMSPGRGTKQSQKGGQNARANDAYSKGSDISPIAARRVEEFANINMRTPTNLAGQSQKGKNAALTQSRGSLSERMGRDAGIAQGGRGKMARQSVGPISSFNATHSAQFLDYEQDLEAEYRALGARHRAAAEASKRKQPAGSAMDRAMRTRKNETDKLVQSQRPLYPFGLDGKATEAAQAFDKAKNPVRGEAADLALGRDRFADAFDGSQTETDMLYGTRAKRRGMQYTKNLLADQLMPKNRRKELRIRATQEANKGTSGYWG